jgi:hypothetical protein
VRAYFFIVLMQSYFFIVLMLSCLRGCISYNVGLARTVYTPWHTDSHKVEAFAMCVMCTMQRTGRIRHRHGIQINTRLKLLQCV